MELNGVTVAYPHCGRGGEIRWDGNVLVCWGCGLEGGENREEWMVPIQVLGFATDRFGELDQGRRETPAPAA